MNEQLLEYQNCVYKILIDFHHFCKEQGLTYYLSSGSLLGAVRHGGFIPWDDDIDVSMPRDDYEKLLSHYSPRLPDHLKLMYYKNAEHFYMNFAKIVNNNTTVVEEYANSYRVEGAYIDVFPIDGAGKTYQKGKWRRFVAEPLIRMSRWSAYPKEVLKGLKRWQSAIIRVAFIFKSPKYYDWLVNFLKRKPYSNSEYVAVYVGNYKYKEIMPWKIYGNPIKIKFIDFYFDAPEDIHGFLKHKYGENYMELPPEEKRISRHKLVYVNINQSYRDFNFDEYINKNKAKT